MGKGIEQPRLEIDYLLAYVLKKKRLEIYLVFDAVVETDQLQKLKELIERRVSGEPLQYILGETDFMGCRIRVNSSVLIPRSETEHMVDEACQRIQERGFRKVLDLGTGSGAIAIAVAKNCEGVRVIAVDSSFAALEVARQNALLNGVGDKIEFVHEDMAQYLEKDSLSDLILSNPPYIPLSEYEVLSASVKNYEPRQALTDEGDGKLFLRKILHRLRERLNSEGEAFLEFGYGLGEWILEEAQTLGLRGVLYQDIACHTRFIRVFR